MSSRIAIIWTVSSRPGCEQEFSGHSCIARVSRNETATSAKLRAIRYANPLERFAASVKNEKFTRRLMRLFRRGWWVAIRGFVATGQDILVSAEAVKAETLANLKLLLNLPRQMVLPGESGMFKNFDITPIALCTCFLMRNCSFLCLRSQSIQNLSRLSLY